MTVTSHTFDVGMRREVMPDLGDVCQMFGLEVPHKTVTS